MLFPLSQSLSLPLSLSLSLSLSLYTPISGCFPLSLAEPLYRATAKSRKEHGARFVQAPSLHEEYRARAEASRYSTSQREEGRVSVVYRAETRYVFVYYLVAKRERERERERERTRYRRLDVQLAV